MDVAQRAFREKQVLDVIRLFGQLDANLTTMAREILVRKMWKPSGPDFDPFTETLGELYMLRQVQRLDLATHAAQAQSKDASHGFLHLAQVPDLNPRWYDGVVIARRPGDLPDMNRSDIEDEVVMRLESKWFLTREVDTDLALDQMSKDLIQSIERGQNLHDIYWSVPESRAAELVESTKGWFRMMFEEETVKFLAEDYGMTPAEIDAFRDALDERLELGNMVFVSPDSSD